MTSPWEFNQVGQLSKVGNWIKKFPGPIRYAGPMLLTQLAFIPLLYSYLTFSYLESVGFNVPGLVATGATWVWSKLPFLPQFGLLLKQVASVLLELPVNASNELVWKGVLQTALPLLPVVYFFIILPILDILIGRDRGGQKPAQRTEEDNGYRWVLWAFGLIYMCLLVMCATTAAALPLLSVVTVGVGLGFYGAVLFAVAHELLHSSSKADRALSQSLLHCLCYPHYMHSHKRIHHARVATPSDPSTARRGEGVYAFVYRSIVDNWRILQKMETNAVTKASWILGPLFIAESFLILLGPKALLIYLLSAAVAIINLEIVNYLEHYGLMRDQLPNGRYDKVDKRHSWNADWLVTNCHIVNLQLHGEHHIDSKRPYYKLENIEDGPQLPGPYPIMILLALFPPLFRRVMDPRLDVMDPRLDEMERERLST